jgi:type VI secretion system secreted protein VgrG
MATSSVFEVSAGDLGPKDLGVVSFRGVEEISRPFWFDVRVTGLADAADHLVGAPAALVLQGHEEAARVVRGMVGSVRVHERRHLNAPVATLRIVPRLASLRTRKDTRIFQDLTVPAIVAKVLDQHNIDHRFTLTRTHAERSYCVQYQETDLAFVRRLLAEEGLFFFFEASADKPAEDMIIVDAAAAYAAIPGDASIPTVDAHGMFDDREHVSTFAWRARERPGSALLTGFDFRRPHLTLTGQERVSARGTAGGSFYEADLPWSRAIVSDEAARAHVEKLRADVGVGAGASTSRRLAPGRTFELTEHRADKLNRSYAVVRVEHTGTVPEVAHGDDRSKVYDNRFWCVPSDVPCRPRPPERKPRQMLETATVVGPEGEEIHTDEHGRVKVQFHWDREGKRNEASSCWIRAMQAWAGSAWGFQFIPRVGMEVVVGFFGGDPDRPMILGAAYNGANVPPHTLPRNKTESGIRTRSSPGGGGFNELRFDDAAAEERVFLRAQRNLDELVLNDHARIVGGNEMIQVEKDRVLEVKQDHVRTVAGNEIVTIEKNFILHVVGNQHIMIDGAPPQPGGKDAGRDAESPGGSGPGPTGALPPPIPEPAVPEPWAAPAVAALSFFVEQLPPELYDAGKALKERALGLETVASYLGAQASHIDAEIEQMREVPRDGALAHPARQRLEALQRRARFLDFEANQLRDTAIVHLAEKETPPPGLEKVTSLHEKHLGSVRDRMAAASQSLAASHAAAAELLPAQQASGEGFGGGGADPVFREGQEVKFAYTKPGTSEKVETAQGSVLDIGSGGGQINSPGGFRIACEGSSIEMTPGGIIINAPMVTILGKPIKLNC